jgi:SAM-dependent methyltransferase
MTSSESTTLSWERWDARYQNANIPWDLGQVAPALPHYAPRVQGRVVVLGCGQGHDAVWLAAQGLEVVGIDFSPLALAAAAELAQAQGVAVTWHQQDIFTLDTSWNGKFDAVFEHTCFCAIAPERRIDYRELVHRWLKPYGQGIGICFTHNRPGGPPFGITPAEIRRSSWYPG